MPRWLPDITVVAGIALVVFALVGVDWRLAVAVIGLVLTAFGVGAERLRGGR